MDKPVEIQISPANSAVTIPTSLWQRISLWIQDNKTTAYTAAGVIVVVTGAGAVYYLSRDNASRLSKKDRRKRREAERTDAEDATGAASRRTTTKSDLSASVQSFDEIPEVDEIIVLTLNAEQRDDYSQKLKAAGNSAYGNKEYSKAIGLYSKAIMCKANDPVFYANRAAAHNALGAYEKVLEDCTAALNLKPEYSKALNRRAVAYEMLERYQEALLDYTALCIIDSFTNSTVAKSVDVVLKKVAEKKAKELIAQRPSKLPSYMFVEKYLQSFRPRPPPEGLLDSVELAENSGKGQLRLGLQAQEKHSRMGYEQARQAFDKAIDLGDLGALEAFAYNMRGTYRCLLGQHEMAMDDFTKSITLDPTQTQCYIKKGSAILEQGQFEQADEQFRLAVKVNADDPDIYYHRAHGHFIKGEFTEAAKDYQKSIDLDGTFVFSYIQLALARCKTGSIASAISTFRRCIKNFPKVPDVYNYYGELLRDQGNISEAIEKFDMAIDLEKEMKPTGMNVLPIINKAWTLYETTRDAKEVEELCEKALTIDPECDVAVATIAQLLLEQGRVVEALKYFERAAELGRTETEIANAISYAEATRTQLAVQEKYPSFAAKLQAGAPPSTWAPLSA